MKGLAVTAYGLIPNVALLITLVYQVIRHLGGLTRYLILSSQPLCTALQLVLTPIVSIGSASPFVTALRQQSAEAAQALVACQRLHMLLLEAPGNSMFALSHVSLIR
jgi:hypothetical protein